MANAVANARDIFGIATTLILNQPHVLAFRYCIQCEASGRPSAAAAQEHRWV